MTTAKLARMKKEMKMLSNSPPPGIFCCLKEGNKFDNLEAQIIGSENTPYAKGVFKLDIQLTDRYPFEPPNVTFTTPIYHPNIDNAGRICLDILKMPPKGAWRPSINLSTVLTSIQLLMSEPNPDDPLMTDIATEFKYNRPTFDLKARQHTAKHTQLDLYQMSQIKKTEEIQQWLDGEVEVNGPRLDREVEEDGARLDGEVEEDGARLDGEVEEDGARLDGEVEEDGARLDGEVEEDGARLDGEVEEDGARLDGEVEEDGARLDGEVEEDGARLDGVVGEDGTRLDGEVEEDGTRLDGVVEVKGPRLDGKVEVDGTLLDGEVGEDGTRLDGEG